MTQRPTTKAQERTLRRQPQPVLPAHQEPQEFALAVVVAVAAAAEIAKGEQDLIRVARRHPARDQIHE